MTDLRSIPVGLRIHNWIFVEQPDLVEMQKNAAQRQLKENLGSTSDNVRASIPPQIYDATMTINAAYAQFGREMEPAGIGVELQGERPCGGWQEPC